MKSMLTRLLFAGLATLVGLPTIAAAQDAKKASPPAKVRIVAPEDAKPFPGTEKLELKGDIASLLVEGCDRFLLRELDQWEARRADFWKRDTSSPEAYARSLEANRVRLASILGVRDPRVAPVEMQLLATPEAPALVGRGNGFDVFAVRWPAFGDVHGEGLLLVPRGTRHRANVVAIPHADHTPEQIAGLADGIPPESQYARRLAEAGCRVVVPCLINRVMGEKKNDAPLGNRGNGLTNREFLYRSAFELGRHLVGYEVQKVVAAVDWLARDKDHSSTGVIGYGDGGMIALYAAALDPRIDVALVSGYIDDRRDIWRQPIDRSVFSLLERFGDAEMLAMIPPRAIVIEAAKGPEGEYPGNGGGAPARLVSPRLEAVKAQVERARSFVASLSPPAQIELAVSGDGQGPFAAEAALGGFLKRLGIDDAASSAAAKVERTREIDAAARHRRQMHEIDRHSQEVLAESHYVRQAFMGKLVTNSLDAYAATVEPYRKFFYDEVIGRYDDKPLPFNPRTRATYEAEKWTGYEVVLDVFPDVIAYGVLLLPKDLKEGEKRPVVVCQHGLEGRPVDVFMNDHGAYHDFAAKLAERGFITFAPQNLYLFTDRFRTLQRKSYPVKKTLYSIITPQHQQIVDWIETLPFVDPKRIAFYGLSYGGKTAMRVPALVTDYCLSICSADFNEWVWKNASSRSPYSYVWTPEYEIFEFDLGSTFNYAEMAALIAPRPFMVERGHFDGVGSDESVSYEYGKVINLYQARLKLEDKCEIEYFVGPHTINGKKTFEFLHRHLNWAAPAGN